VLAQITTNNSTTTERQVKVSKQLYHQKIMHMVELPAPERNEQQQPSSSSNSFQLLHQQQKATSRKE